MFKHTRSAVTLLAASIKASLLVGLDKLQKKSAERARGHMMASIIEDRLANRTPGAFGRVIQPTRYRGPGGGLWRRNAATGKVRGF